MNTIFKNFIKLNKTKKQTISNLPSLIKNRNEISQYLKDIEEKNITESDPLFLRINIKKYGIDDYLSERESLFKRLILYFKYSKAKFFNKNQYRYEKQLERVNCNSRQMFFNVLPKNYRITFTFALFSALVLTYIIGYFYARLKYDTYARRYMYVHFTSYMLLFEYIDYKVFEFLNKVNQIVPKEFSNKEAEFLFLKGVSDYFERKRINRKINKLIETDVDLLELDEILKKINN